jgi:lysophospholipase L1-like esterase
MVMGRALKQPASWILATAQTLALLACGSHIAHSQRPPARSIVHAPPATMVRDATPIASADPDEPAADVAVLESEAPIVSTDAASTATDAATELATLTPTVPTDVPAVAEPVPMCMPIAIDDAIEGRSLSAFHHALARAAAGQGQARILFYGASHVASDIFTGRVREALQTRFGDAGAGFVMLAKPWPHYRHALIEHLESSGWHAPRVRARHPVVGRFGLAGVALEAGDRNAVAKLHTRSAGTTTGNASRFELMYLKQPDGGQIRIVLDGQPVATLSTAGDDAQAAYFPFPALDGPHEIEINTFADGPVTIFGLTLERDQPGVILDTVGIPGARARYHLFWDDALYREHVMHRAPDLVVLAYGTNEAGDKDVPIEDYEHELRDVVGRLKSTAAGASCLLIGPSDRPERLADGTYAARERVPQIVEAQRRTAHAMGCGFFDLVAFMGGPMSMVRWAAAIPAYGAPDHVHYTRRGYEALGDALFSALVAGYVSDDVNAPTAARSVR